MVRRFACTHCGARCNRSPEVELSEAAELADAFVFRLMFRLSGRIVDAQSLGERNQALATAIADRDCKAAIVRRMKSGALPGLPTLRDVREHSEVGAATTSMRLAWQIAVEDGLIEPERMQPLLANQLSAIDRHLATGLFSSDAREMLFEMRAEYGHALAALAQTRLSRGGRTVRTSARA